MSLAEDLARRTAIAIDNSQLYERARDAVRVASIWALSVSIAA